MLADVMVSRERMHAANLEQSQAAIVIMANSLGLYPSPSAQRADLWNAQCPRRNHFLLLNTKRDEFWCGYCNRHGSAPDLVAFVQEPKKAGA